MLEKLELEYHESTLSFELAELNFTDPQRDPLAYQLMGLQPTPRQTRTRPA